jgi:exosortase family protein XrtF
MDKSITPVLRFLAVLLITYVGMNALYGLWIASYGNRPDPLTDLVTRQSGYMLYVLGEHTTIRPKPGRPAIVIEKDSRPVISVFEGCNSINVMIVFLTFVLAMGGQQKKMIPFLVVGFLSIYTVNLLRIMGLYAVAVYRPTYFYYTHKYAFTGIIYLWVMVLWWWWMEKINKWPVRKTLWGHA